MHPALRTVLLSASARRAWRPTDLGSALLGLWDAERSDLITQSGGAVSSWKDVVGGYDAVQALSSSKPTYSAAGFNNRPVVTFDGVDDELTAAMPASFPLGSSACELWALVDQAAPVGDVSTRYAFAYGGSGGNNNRGIQRTVTTGVNTARLNVGNGSTVFVPAPGDFSGRRIFRGEIQPTVSRASTDGAVGSDVAVVPNTTSTRLRIGGNNNAPSATNLHQGGISALLVTAPLDTDQAAKLYAYLNARRA